MRDVLRLDSFPDEVWIVRHLGRDAPAGGKEIAPETASAGIEGWLPTGGRRDSILRELCATASGLTAPVCNEPRALLATVQQALREGRLRAYWVKAVKKSQPVDRRSEKPVPPPPRVERAEEKTWIAIQLVTDDPEPKPVPFKKYRIELPDHSVREGMLDENGMAHIAGIDPGSCTVSFPELHGEEWGPA